MTKGIPVHVDQLVRLAIFRIMPDITQDFASTMYHVSCHISRNRSVPSETLPCDFLVTTRIGHKSTT
jgi:hypothetical protein